VNSPRGADPSFIAKRDQLSFYNGFQALLLGMIGEYLIRILNTTSEQRCFHVREIVKKNR
ncbi:MAG: hypothetical protein K2Z81_26370, partial [Cyanobacteria bacterium]|nr:hypothetical protein [Cyanobacteriota bacterium]